MNKKQKTIIVVLIILLLLASIYYTLTKDAYKSENISGTSGTNPSGNPVDPVVVNETPYVGDPVLTPANDPILNPATNNTGNVLNIGNTQLGVFGCTDPTANNYNPNAGADDGSCSYSSYGNDAWFFGCCNQFHPNFDPTCASNPICQCDNFMC